MYAKPAVAGLGVRQNPHTLLSRLLRKSLHRKKNRVECSVSGCSEPKHCAIQVEHSPELLCTGQIGGKVDVCSAHYRTFYRKEHEVTCFVCNKREERRGSFHRPVNAQLLQTGTINDASQTALNAARLCDACHKKDSSTTLTEQQKSSDAMLDMIVAKLTSESLCTPTVESTDAKFFGMQRPSLLLQ